MSLFRGTAEAALYLRASKEHSFNYAPSTLTPPLTGGWPVWPPTERVQRGPSEAARCASKGG